MKIKIECLSSAVVIGSLWVSHFTTFDSIVSGHSKQKLSELYSLNQCIHAFKPFFFLQKPGLDEL